jgi:hypothetical protein
MGDGLRAAAERLRGRNIADCQGPTGDDIDMRAAIMLAHAYLAGRTWQPIETAPKDGTRILLWCGSKAHTFVGQWSRGSWVGAKYHTPTHWIPLPAPPA